jgi:hypothetical protein
MIFSTPIRTIQIDYEPDIQAVEDAALVRMITETALMIKNQRILVSHHLRGQL